MLILKCQTWNLNTQLSYFCFLSLSKWLSVNKKVRDTLRHANSLWFITKITHQGTLLC